MRKAAADIRGEKSGAPIDIIPTTVARNRNPVGEVCDDKPQIVDWSATIAVRTSLLKQSVRSVKADRCGVRTADEAATSRQLAERSGKIYLY